jgi:hypothetical protein
VKSLINSFDVGYLINLPDRTDRRIAIEREFRSTGVELPNPKFSIYPRIRPVDKANFHSVGARGSFSSHREVLKLAAKQGARNVLICEDDAQFRRVPAAIINNITSALWETTWDVVYLGYLKPLNPRLRGPLAEWQHETLGGHFYCVSAPFISTMIEYMNECEMRPRDHPEGGPMSRDGAYNHIRRVKTGIRVLIAIPNLAFQRSTRSDIAVSGVDRIQVLRPFMRSVRVVKNWWRI